MECTRRHIVCYRDREEKGNIDFTTTDPSMHGDMSGFMGLSLCYWELAQAVQLQELA